MASPLPSARVRPQGRWPGSIVLNSRVWLPTKDSFVRNFRQARRSHPRPRAVLLAHKAGVNAIAFAPDDETLASASAERTVILWDAAAHRPVGPPLAGHPNWVSKVAFSPDGKTRASGCADRRPDLATVEGGARVPGPVSAGPGGRARDRAPSTLGADAPSWRYPPGVREPGAQRTREREMSAAEADGRRSTGEARRRAEA